MARTTSANVTAILVTDKNYDGSTSLAAFIDTATALVDEVVTCAAKRGITLSATLLELIERWLAAHFYAHADPLYTSRSTQGASGSFQGQTGMHLESTQYGQTAMVLDTSRCLAAINKGGSKIGAVWLGKPRSEQIDYVDRD